MKIDSNWEKLKEFHLQTSARIVWFDDGHNYHVSCECAELTIQTIISKENPENPDLVEFEATYKALRKINNLGEISKLPPQQPYAEPTYRTKHNKTEDPIICVNGTTTTIDYILQNELYASGGELVVKNPQFGDWIAASIHDPNGVIPAPYRPAVCENWPVVAEYIQGQYLPLYDSQSTFFKMGIDTRPLVAKISPGLALRVTYYAKNIEGASDREVLINYFLSKKL